MPKKKVIKEEKVVLEQKVSLAELKLALDNAEKQIKLAKKLLFQDIYFQKASSLSLDKNIVEGIFDGTDMLGADGKKYAVPCNYASKSKLVAGDILKLTTGEDGIQMYKQIGPIERVRLKGVLCENDDGYHVQVKDRIYNILAASVTYFKAKDGDKLTLLVAKDYESNWAAVDNVIS